MWTFETGDVVKSSPTVDPKTGLMFTGSHDGFIYALDPLVICKINTSQFCLIVFL